MQELTSPRSQSLSNPWEKNFILKRIGEEDMVISEATRNSILQAMQSGAQYIQIGLYTIMVNGIKSIEPRYGEANIPRRPDVRTVVVSTEGNQAYWEEDKNDIELQKKWDELYAEKAHKQKLLK